MIRPVDPSRMGASSSARIVLPAASGPSMATRTGCGLSTARISSASDSRQRERSGVMDRFYVTRSVGPARAGRGASSLAGSVTGEGYRPSSGPRAGRGASSLAGSVTGEGYRPSSGPRAGRGASSLAGSVTGKGYRPSSGPRAGRGDSSLAGSVTGKGYRPSSGPRAGRGASSLAGSVTGEGYRPSSGPRAGVEPPRWPVQSLARPDGERTAAEVRRRLAP